MKTIATITANDDYTLNVVFTDGVKRRYDVRPLLTSEAFEPLSDLETFKAVHNRGYFIEWECGADLSADTLYLTTKTDEPSYHAVARLFGIEEPQSIVDLINIVRHGLPSEGVTALSDKLGITPSEMSKYLHASLKTLQRNKSKVLDINISDRLLTVALVYSKCVDVFESEEVSAHWLKTPLQALSNATPLEYLDTNAGAEMIMNLLVRIEYGVHS